MDRRQFLGASAAVVLAAPAWGAEGAPDVVTAANRADNSTWLVGLRRDGSVAFSLPIPSRGHAAAAHPTRTEVVAFSRRPGVYATVVDCTTGAQLRQLRSPEGRHFYGHGAFTADGAYLLTTENDYDAPAGRLGVWDVAAGYTRVDELTSGGIGPHEIIALASGGFAVANGGIQTHPSSERARLNLPTMMPNLTWLDSAGQVTGQAEPPASQRLNSIRHIAEAPDGRILAALQWQGDPRQAVPALAAITPDGITYLEHPDAPRLRHYAGSVAISRDGARIAVTGPKGGHVLYFDGSGTPTGGAALPLVSGAAPMGTGDVLLTWAEGLVLSGAGGDSTLPVPGGWTFDNHLVPV